MTTVASLLGPRGGTSVAAMLLSLGLAAAIAQAQAPAPAAAPAAPAAAGQAAPAAAADAQALKALFIEVNGKVQWRSGADQPWQNAKVDDVVTPGAEVRTGLKSFAALRVGDNATALIDAGTMFQMPSVVKDGDTLRTTVSVKSGRADFKVDKVGLTNDFKVVTPSTTLAVRGTEFAVASGALKNVEVLGARRNTINAIELKYALNNTTVRMSGAAASNSNLKQPTHNAVVATASPATAGALPSTNSTETVSNAAVGPSPANAGSPAEAQQSNNAAAKTQTAVSREQTSDDGNSLAARIARAIKDAKTRADKAIAYLLAMDGELATIDGQKQAMVSLAQLAAARRAEARLALLQNHEALRGIDGNGGILAKLDQAAAEVEDFDELAGLIDQQLASFEAAKAQVGLSPTPAPARGLAGMEAFAQQVAGDGPGLREDGSRWNADADEDGTADVVEDMTAVRNALIAMGGHFAGARASMIGMADAIEAVDDLLVAIEAGELPASREAIEQFAAAIALLDEYADADTTSAVQLATAAKDAAAALKAIIDGADVVGSSPTAELLEKAAEAADKLDTAHAGLLQVVQAAQAVKDIRDAYETERAGDPRIELLGRVEEVYDEMVAMHVAMLVQWTALDAPAQGDQPAGRFAAAEAAMHALLGTKGAGQSPRTVGRAEQAFDGIAVLAPARAEQAADRAEAVIAPVSAQDPRSADQVAYDAALESVDQAIADASRVAVLADAESRTADGAAVANLTIDLATAIEAHADRIDGAQPTSALEPLYRAVPVVVTRTVDFENTPGVPFAPQANTGSEPGVAGASNLVPGTYAGFSWNGQAWAFRRDAGEVNGFTNGVVSGSQGAYNNAQGEFFLSRSDEWTPESAWFTGAWSTGLVLTFVGTRDGVELAPVSITLGAPTGPQQVSLRALGLTDVTLGLMSTSGGTRFGGLPGCSGGEAFGMVVRWG
ncbi:MAG: FecR domain-containing protein, partial [Phycisphaerales bacterium]